MAPLKRTIMVLKVDLQCDSCYKKVKKVLCKYPQITDNVFDENANTVTITVICCSPEKIRDKIRCKGGKAIMSIEIQGPEKPKPAEKPKEPEKPKVVEKPKEPEKPKVVEKPKEPEKPKVVEKPKEPEKPKVPEKKVMFTEPEKPKSNDKPAKPVEKPPKADPPPALKPAIPIPEPGIVKMPEPVHGYPPLAYPPTFSVPVCCGECYHGHGGGPCHNGFGRPVPPPPGPCYDGYGYGYGGNRACYVTRCDYLSEENPSGCSIM